jgi:hypothetical protein
MGNKRICIASNPRGDSPLLSIKDDPGLAEFVLRSFAVAARNARTPSSSPFNEGWRSHIQLGRRGRNQDVESFSRSVHEDEEPA